VRRRRRHADHRSALARVVGAWLLCAALVGPAMAQTPQASERVVKAVFLYKFLNYAEWPAAAFADPDAPFVIGVLGADDVARELSQVATDRPAAGRPVQVRRMKRGESLAGLHMLFVGAADSREVPALARLAHANAVLVVSEDTRSGKPESAINLVVDEGKVRFDVTPDVAEKAGIKLSSRLLGVARFVRQAGEP
jgi:hypothetical protein